jgi:cytochrome c oxidase subunit 4
MSANAHAHKHTSLAAYVGIYFVLLVLTVVTYLTAQIDLGSFNIVLAMTIALVKGGLVVTIFMHLLEHKMINRAFFILGLFFVALLIGILLADVRYRLPTVNPPTSVRG